MNRIVIVNLPSYDLIQVHDNTGMAIKECTSLPSSKTKNYSTVEQRVRWNDEIVRSQVIERFRNRYIKK